MSFYMIPTAAGEAKIAAHLAGGPKVEIAWFAVGDGGGAAVVPNPAATALVNEVYRKPVDSLSVHNVALNQMQAEAILPSAVGGWWMRECGLIDTAGDLIAHGSMPASYKPLAAEGAAREMIVRSIFAVSSSASIEILIDPSLVFATQTWVLAFNYATQPWVLAQLERNRPRRFFMNQI
jgi:phage-related tail fiber protein